LRKSPLPCRGWRRDDHRSEQDASAPPRMRGLPIHAVLATKILRLGADHLRMVRWDREFHDRLRRVREGDGVLKPYYEQDGITIWNCDCLEIVAAIEADAIVTDPPYGVGFSSSMGGKFDGAVVEGDESTAVRDRVLSLRGDLPAIVFGSWKQPTPHDTKALLVWDKGIHVGMGDLSMPWKPNHEFIYILGGGFEGHRGSGVLSFNAPSPNFQHQFHPTEKPVALMRELVSKCPADWTILDPFMGSGTTLRAAKDLGRKAIGIEIEERYCETAAKRLQQGILFPAQ